MRGKWHFRENSEDENNTGVFENAQLDLTDVIWNIKLERKGIQRIFMTLS